MSDTGDILIATFAPVRISRARYTVPLALRTQPVNDSVVQQPQTLPHRQYKDDRQGSDGTPHTAYPSPSFFMLSYSLVGSSREILAADGSRAKQVTIA